MRLISFSLTEPQFLDGSKTVTRRMGWRRVKAGDRLVAVRKAMGLKKGEKVHRLGLIEVTATWLEPLNQITHEQCVREGFPHMEPDAFVEFFCKSHKGCKPYTPITVIQFKKIDGGAYD